MTAGPDRAALIEDGRLNTSYLKLDLFCRGLRLGPDFDLGGAQGPVRMRSGLGSGLELRLPGRGRLHVNAPVVEPFAAASPYELGAADAPGRHVLRHEGRALTSVVLPPRPAFLDQRTRSGRPMSSVGVVQGTYLGVYFGLLCANWKRPDDDACRFCSVGTHVQSGDEDTGKSVDDVVETALAAQRELGITFVHINGGFDDRERYLTRFLPLVQALRRSTSLLIGLQVPPLAAADYVALKAAGVDNVSLCFEVWDPRRFDEVCPGKGRRAPLEAFRAAIRTCATDVRFATTNGEMIAGLEPVPSSMAAVDWLTATGAVPTICVFRPVQGTHYADRPPPATEDLVPLFAHAWRQTLAHDLPIGIAPNVHVSIVLTPEEWRGLVPPAERNAFRATRWRHALVRSGFRSAFAARRVVHGWTRR